MNVFCAKCQSETDHSAIVDHNAEIVLTCEKCQGFIKLAAGMTEEQIREHLAVHAQANAGQVSAAALDASRVASQGILERLMAPPPIEQVIENHMPSEN